MKTFYHLLVNSLIAGVTTNFVWFALTFWAYLQTKSVITTSIVAGSYLVANALSSLWFGAIVDHHKKKSVIIASSLITLVIFAVGFILYFITPLSTFTSVASIRLWIFIILLLVGVIVGNIRYIALPILTVLLVPEDKRDRANGMSGTVTGIAFAITSVTSGFVLAYGGMIWVLLLACFFTLLAIIHMFFIQIPEKEISHTDDKPKKLEIGKTITAIKAVPGLFALIFFTTFNNLLGGVFMSLMDAYGLSLVSLQVWGSLWGFLSLGFIVGGVYISKKGLGKNPLRSLFITNIIMWTISIFFTVNPSIILLASGMFMWMSLMPFIEASEQTIFQKVVPVERLGRVFGFAHSIESAASPLSAFFIGPIAQFIFIPFMTTGAGVNLIGSWFGVGVGRGIALVFIVAGLIGLTVTLLAMRSKSYRLLSGKFTD